MQAYLLAPRFRGNRAKQIASAVLLAAALVLSITARKVPGFAQWYSTHLYPVWVGSLGRLTGYLPFSAAEILLYLLLASLLLFTYTIGCGINYHRDSFSECSGIQAEEYTADELKAVCQWLTDKVADYAGSVPRGPNGGMVLKLDLQDNAAEAMRALKDEYPELEGYYPQPKELMNSWILSVQNLSGVYSPFTIEANYNGDMQDYNIPFTACHELSHLRGFMQEQEANFIAFLACSGSEEEAFAYSGYLMGWIHCMNVLYRADYDAWEEVRSQLPQEAEQDLKLNREFWAEYDGRIAEVSNRVNDTYLKANGQSDGVKSYNRMVDLIVAYYERDGR